jgi:uncharacterized protein (TIGR02145 family)
MNSYLKLVLFIASVISIFSCADDLKAIEWTSSEISSSSGASSSSSLNVQQVSSSSSSLSSSSYEQSSSSGVIEKCEWKKGGAVIEVTEAMALVNGGTTVTAYGPSNEECEVTVLQWAVNNMLRTNIKCGGVDCPNIKIKNPAKEGQFIDTRDKQIYQIAMGWMAENLNYGGDIGNKYGESYNWETAKTACPEGWRLPNDSDLNNLVGRNNEGPLDANKVMTLILCGYNSQCNATGFTALAVIGDRASWWSSVDRGQQEAIALEINTSFTPSFPQDAAGSISTSSKTTSHSVRCVRGQQ